MTYTKLLSIIAVALAFTTSLASTSHAMGVRPPKDTARPPASAPTPKPTPKPPVATPAPSTGGSSGSYKAYWEGKHPDAANWTRYAQEAIERYGDSMIKGAQDIQDFCPMYDRLGHQDKTNFWVELLAAMTKFESSFKPTMRYTESTMGTDPVTGKQVVSEGLLQLSYQDERSYRSVLPAGVCDFDFESDSKLAITDVRRTILDPKTNLICGIGILNRQIDRYGKIAIASGAYWAVIKSNSKYSKLTEIRQITRNLSFCK